MDSRWFAALQIVPALLTLLVLYWLFLKPIQKQIAKHRKLLKELKAGDSVMTESGMLARVDVLIEPDLVRLWIAPDRFVVLKRAGIAEIVDAALVDRAWSQDG